MLVTGYWALGDQRREIVVERERRRILRIAGAVVAAVAGTEVAIGVVAWHVVDRDALDLSLPWTIGPLRRHQYPVSAERVETTMCQSPVASHQSAVSVISRS